jgi:hypothetical protein
MRLIAVRHRCAMAAAFDETMGVPYRQHFIKEATLLEGHAAQLRLAHGDQAFIIPQ